MIFDLCAKFQLSSMNRSVSRTPLPWSHTWRTLKVSDWRLGGLGHPWYHISLWYFIIYLCAKFQLSSMHRSVSRTSPSSKSYLEDAEGSWLETWGIGSSFKCWIILGDPRNLSWKFCEDLTSFGWDIGFWRLIGTHTQTNRNTDSQTDTLTW